MTRYIIPQKTDGHNYSTCPNCNVQKVVVLSGDVEFPPENLKFSYAPYCYNCGKQFEC